MCLVRLPSSHQTISITADLLPGTESESAVQQMHQHGDLLVVTFALFPSFLPYPGSALLSQAPLPSPLTPPLPPFRFPVDAASCLVHAGALEQSVAACNASCLSQTAPVLTRPIWQCGNGYTELTERVTLLDLDFAAPLSNLQGKGIARFALPTSCPCQTQQGLAQN